MESETQSLAEGATAPHPRNEGAARCQILESMAPAGWSGECSQARPDHWARIQAHSDPLAQFPPNFQYPPVPEEVSLNRS